MHDVQSRPRSQDRHTAHWPGQRDIDAVIRVNWWDVDSDTSPIYWPGS
jgi:hypothetical protein